MESKFKKEGDKTILEIDGRLDTSNYESFQKLLDEKLDEGEKHIIVDMEGLEYVSSSGLRVFLAALKKIRANGGDIVLCCMSDKIMEVFDISGFSSLFKIFVRMDDALGEN